MSVLLCVYFSKYLLVNSNKVLTLLFILISARSLRTELFKFFLFGVGSAEDQYTMADGLIGKWQSVCYENIDPFWDAMGESILSYPLGHVGVCKKFSISLSLSLSLSVSVSVCLSVCLSPSRYGFVHIFV